MSHHEVDSLKIIQQVDNRLLTQKQAVTHLNLSIRQVKRLIRRFRHSGTSGQISKRRGKRPNNHIGSMTKDKALSLIKHTYALFRPPLLKEPLNKSG